jgi:curved DNA-binding protein CbpA
MDSSDNPYEILGISSDADEAAIKKAYRQEARIHHPDKQNTDEDRERATAKFAKIADAYDLLQDPVRRYDWRMSQEGKSKRITQKPSSFRSTTSTASTTSTSTINRTSISPRQPPTRMSTTPTASASARKRASVHSNAVRVSPPSAASSTTRMSSVRTALPPNTRPSTLRSPVRPQRSQSVQGGKRGNHNATGMRMKNSMSVESDLLTLRRPAGSGSRKTTGMPMRNSMSMDSDMHKLHRPAGGRKKSRGTTPPRNPVSRNRPRDALSTHSEHIPSTRKPSSHSERIPSTRKPGRMSRESLDVKKTPAKEGKLKRTFSLRSMASLAPFASIGSRASSVSRSVRTSS